MSVTAAELQPPSIAKSPRTKRPYRAVQPRATAKTMVDLFTAGQQPEWGNRAIAPKNFKNMFSCLVQVTFTSP